KTAADARQALTLALSFNPELAILDIGLPDRNGYDLARDLRRVMDSACPTLIAVTGWGQAEDRARARAAGFSEHLTNPADPYRVRYIIRWEVGKNRPDHAGWG